jgi:hypothetical protein
VDEKDKAEIQRLLFLKPLPFVSRVVMVCAPHRGSYLSGNFARTIARRIVTLPSTLVDRSAKLLQLTEGSEASGFLKGKLPTSLDGMSPKNPTLLAMADIPISPPIKSHSIVAILGDDQPPEGGDGVVKYKSAHVDYVESEFIVRYKHSCLDQPATIEEVRRILRKHLEELK